MASENEIDEALDVAKQYGNGEVLLFHCTSNYPTVTEESNIKMISTFRDKYDCEIGLSDHTLDETAALAAVSLGTVLLKSILF